MSYQVGDRVMLEGLLNQSTGQREDLEGVVVAAAPDGTLHVRVHCDDGAATVVLTAAGLILRVV